MAEAYDPTVIGTGAAAQAAVLRCQRSRLERCRRRSLTLRQHIRPGRVQPEKVLVGTEALDRARRLDGNGLDIPYAGIEWLETRALSATC